MKGRCRGTTQIAALAFSPDGETLVTAQCMSGPIVGECVFWDVTNGQIRAKSIDHLQVVTDDTYSPDGRFVASTSEDRTVTLRDANTGYRLATLLHHTQPVMSVAFSADGKTLVTGGSDGTIQLSDVENVLHDFP